MTFGQLAGAATDPALCGLKSTLLTSMPSSAAAGGMRRTRSPRVVRRLCRAAEVDVADLDAVVAHQSNTNILKAAADDLGLPHDRIPATLERLGNTLAAGLPIALAEAINGGRLGSGSLVATVGYGGGLNAGGQLWRL